MAKANGEDNIPPLVEKALDDIISLARYKFMVLPEARLKEYGLDSKPSSEV
ncbi:hypothetical protein [Allorhizobium ampelinum]|uniref:hypothetical protein n=1 Tax=Allorhizobium ampelinum TaxID=3025782 RepID=UPI001F2BE75D|nr:hypothetical protein [Allorhizobium ampelinum]